MKQEIIFAYHDFMREAWNYYHKYILHRSRYDITDWILCNHHNPWHILTPRLFDKQMKEISKNA